jgi:membrane protease YdiL (CAAX protease family)
MSAEPRIPPRPDVASPVPAAPPRPGERPTATWGWLEAVGVYVLGFLLAGFATLPLLGFLDEDQDLTTVVLTTISALVIIGVLLLWLSRFHRGWPQVMRLPEPGTWGREIGAGALFGIGLYPVMVGIVGGVLVVLFERLSGQTVQPPEQVGNDLSAVGLAITIVYAIVIAPLGEELFFRGVLFRTLRDRHGFWVGAMGSGIAFALIHFIPDAALDSALLMIVMGLTGVALCFVYERRGTIVAPVAAHVVFNVIGLTLILGLR